MNRICKILCFLTLIVGPLFAAPTLVTVSQTLYRADGTAARGSVYITWPTFTTGAGEQIPAGSKQVTLTSAGLLTVQLAPNLGATPTGTRYLVTYRLDLGTPRNTAWIVPSSGPVTVSTIESTTLTAPSSVISLLQLNTSGASNGNCIGLVLGVWAPMSCSGGGGGSGFDAISTGTNSTATMTLGSGSSMVRSGTGIIDANKLMGTALLGITGVVKMTSGVPSTAAASDIVGTFTGTPDGSKFLRDDGTLASAPGGVSSVFSRTGAVVATTGDYTAAQVTNAVSSAATYNDPSWLVTLLSTKLTFVALGDIVYGGAAGAGTRLAGNTTSTRKFLRQTGTGTVSAAPAWDTIQASDVPTLNQSTSGNAATATALAANGTNCSSGHPALGVDASGNAEGCAALTTSQVTGPTGGGDQCLQSDNAGSIVGTGSACGSGGTGATTNQNIRRIAFHFDGQGSAISGTVTGCQYIPFAGSITGWYMDADQAGSATIGVHSVVAASYTGTAGYGTYTDVTGGGTAPSLSSASYAAFANLTSWTTTVTAGYVWCFQLTSPSTLTWANVYLKVSAN